MHSKMTVLFVLAFVVAMTSAAPKPRTVYTSPLAAALTYTAPGGIAYHGPAAIVYPVLDSNSQIMKDQNCPGCPELGEGLAASFVTATPAYYI